MIDGTIETGVDRLLDILKEKEKIALKEAADELNVKQDVLQKWVDFLVEEKIVGIEYSFTKPYIYLNKPEEKKKTKIIEEQDADLKTFKEEFTQKAVVKNIPQDKIPYLWKNHVQRHLEESKEFFMSESKKRSLENADQLWDEYQQKIMQEI